MTNTEPVRGPMYVAATSLQVTVDVEPLVAANVGELLDLLCSDEFYGDFRELADNRPSSDRDRADARLAFEELQARLVDRMCTRVGLTGPQAMRVAGQMAELARPLAALSAHTAAVVQRAQRHEGRAA